MCEKGLTSFIRRERYILRKMVIVARVIRFAVIFLSPRITSGSITSARGMKQIETDAAVQCTQFAAQSFSMSVSSMCASPPVLRTCAPSMRPTLLAAFLLNVCVLVGVLADTPTARPDARAYTRSIRGLFQMLEGNEEEFPSYRPAFLAGLDTLEQWSASAFREQERINAVLLLLSTCNCIVMGFLYRASRTCVQGNHAPQGTRITKPS